MDKEKKIRLFWQICGVLYLLVIAVLCFCKINVSQDVPSKIWGIESDKIVHFIMFLPFPIISLYAVHKSTGSIWRFLLFVFVMYTLGMMTGMSIEFIQGQIPGRSTDLNDFIADSCGLATGTLIVTFFRAVSRKW